MKEQEAQAAAEERKLAAEAEERKLMKEQEAQAAAEERKLAAEAEERKLAAEERKLATEERRVAAAAEAEEKKALREFELERIRLELEAKRLDAENQGATQRRIMPARVKSPDLPSFIDGKGDLDSYLEICHRCKVGGRKEIWATQLSALLSGKALDVYSRLSQEDALDYKKLKEPEGQESPGQFIIRLKNYFSKWVQLSEVEAMFEGVSDLTVRERFSSRAQKS